MENAERRTISHACIVKKEADSSQLSASFLLNVGLLANRVRMAGFHTESRKDVSEPVARYVPLDEKALPFYRNQSIFTVQPSSSGSLPHWMPVRVLYSLWVTSPISPLLM